MATYKVYLKGNKGSRTITANSLRVATTKAIKQYGKNKLLFIYRQTSKSGHEYEHYYF
jgi:hypothetical protein